MTEVDPRIRARRVAVTREAGRRRLRRVLLVLGAVGVVGALAGIIWSPLLDVDEVDIVGAGERAPEVRSAAQVERGAALLLLDAGAVEARIEALAWVGDAEVERDLPGTLRVTVHRRPPVAIADRPDGRVALVDATGFVTAVVDRAPGGMPVLVTREAPPDAGERVRPTTAARIAGAVGPLAGRVARISVDGGQGALLLTDGIEVRLGTLDRLVEKARAADAVLGAPGIADPEGITYVDVRVPSAPVTG